MATYAVKNLTFTYPGKTEPALKDVTLNIEMGEFIAVCGQSGSGKSTLLRNLKPILAPHGDRQGDILFYGEPIENMSQQRQAARIGYVLQNPDNQIVTDKVWHELAFGLESLGLDTKTIRLRVAEMASFFGIQGWFHKDVDQLSGGQRQLLNLAAVMAMQPDVLILDEPTSQLDPIAAGDFLETVGKINRELGTTVIITEHRLEDVLPMADRAIVLDKGKVIADDIPANVGAILAKENHPMFMAMPTPLQAYAILYQDGISKNLACPVNVREGRNWLTDLLRGEELVKTKLPADEEKEPAEDPVIEMKDVWFRYERSEPDVVKDLSLKVYPGEMFCLVGGNGTGKTTTLTLASGIRRPYRGTVKLKGKAIDKYKKNELFDGVLGVLPQNPQSIFVEKTVQKDLLEIFEGRDLD
ncbi:MAG: ABC transporter ATP-binding protein, partial [Firmicutes bacterium]|nr:ABC transporter ATP-binding protein [Bacillota bacterium]